MKVDDRHRNNWQVGDWTDDSDQMILIIEMIIGNPGRVNKFIRRFHFFNDSRRNCLAFWCKKVLLQPCYCCNDL